MRKIIEIRTIASEYLGDREVCINEHNIMAAAFLSDKPREEPKYRTEKGLNTLMTELLQDGYEPYGEMKVVFKPTTVVPPPAHLNIMSPHVEGGEMIFMREFVKYAE